MSSTKCCGQFFCTLCSLRLTRSESEASKLSKYSFFFNLLASVFAQRVSSGVQAQRVTVISLLNTGKACSWRFLAGPSPCYPPIWVLPLNLTDIRFCNLLQMNSRSFSQYSSITRDKLDTYPFAYETIGMKIDRNLATSILREESQQALEEFTNKTWAKKIVHFSNLCNEGGSLTHIAFLGTSILAKTVNASVDLYAIKPEHAKNNKNAYSARSLCHSVLVPLSAELGLSLGVTGREPLNNQPYFRMTKLDDGTPVHAASRGAFSYMLSLIDDLSKIRSEATARQALRAFIYIRKQQQVRYTVNDSKIKVTPDNLSSLIAEFVSENSDGGKRAQAVTAGLFDVVYGIDRIESGRINDPSRKYPGDVCIKSLKDSIKFDKAIEVRDKPVNISDLQIFGKKCLDMGVLDAAVVMVSPKQATLDINKLNKWASELGITMTLFSSWPALVTQIIFWSETFGIEATANAVRSIELRLISAEASPTAVKSWQKLTRK